MTTPNLPAAGLPGGYFFVANAGNGATSGLADFSQWTQGDWDDFLWEQWNSKFSGMGAGNATLRALVNAIISVFQGDTGPLSELIGEVIEGLEVAWDVLVAVFRGEYTGDDSALLSVQSIFSALSGAVSGAERVLQQIADVFAGLAVTPVNAVVATVKDWFAGLSGWQSSTSAAVSSLADGQLDLNTQVELLSPLQQYGSCYAAGGEELKNTGTVPFATQIGPMTGCHLDGAGGIVLEEAGLWDIRARLAFSWTIGDGDIDWQVRVLAPDGSTFSTQRDQATSMNSTTRECGSSVVVPAPGYIVRVVIVTLVIGRYTKGGPNNNRLTVHHISRDTSHQI